jgi:hypothetical protein
VVISRMLTYVSVGKKAVQRQVQRSVHKLAWELVFVLVIIEESRFEASGISALLYSFKKTG